MNIALPPNYRPFAVPVRPVLRHFKHVEATMTSNKTIISLASVWLNLTLFFGKEK